MQDCATTPAESGDSPRYSRVTADQVSEMAAIRRTNPKATYAEIAAAVGVASVSTVSYWLTRLERDTVPEARKLAKSESLRATMKIAGHVDNPDPRVSLGASKALVALAGVQETGPAVQVGVQVIVGSAQQPAGPDPFDSHKSVVHSEPVSD